MKLISVQRIWHKARHNAFTDLIRFQDHWLCVFREGNTHVSLDGELRIIRSDDAKHWESAALFAVKNADLRDGKLCISPNNQLMLTGAKVIRNPENSSLQSLAWFSPDANQWTPPQAIGDTNFWLWRVTWHEGVAYSVGYCGGKEGYVNLYSSKDGKHFSVLVDHFCAEGMPNESSLIFDNEYAYCLLRREQAHGLIGVAKPPYTNWQWHDIGTFIGGPHFIKIPDGRLIAAVRLYDKRVRTALGWIDPKTFKFSEALRLPSRGDTSYPGLVWYKDRLWVSYYSSHRDKQCAIYLAKVRLTEK